MFFLKAIVKKKYLLYFTILIGLTGIITGYFMTLSDREAVAQAENYVENWSSGQSADSFTQKLKTMSTESFIKERLDSEVKTYQGRADSGIKDTNKIVKTLLIDKRPTATEAIVYYSEHVTDGNYDAPMQADIILFKEGNSWKVQNAYILNRTGQDVPKTSDDEEKVQHERYNTLQKLTGNWLDKINTNNEKEYISGFAKDADKNEISSLFKSLTTDNKKFLVTGFYVLGSSNCEAYVMGVALESSKDKQQNTIIDLKLNYEDGLWKISKADFSKS